MRASSKKQLELDYSGSSPGAEPSTSAHLSVEAPDGPGEDRGRSFTPIEIPEFGASGAYAATARLAGRINAASVSEKEVKELLDERQSLLDKKLHGEITRRESNRLEYVRWTLDRIEDARYGHSLDFLEHSVQMYEKLLSDLQSLQDNLARAKRRK